MKSHKLHEIEVDGIANNQNSIYSKKLSIVAPESITNVPELEIIEYISNHALNRGTFIDAGAHLGFYTILLAGFFDQVISFEPSTYQRELLIENVYRNEIDNCTVRQEALGSSTAEIDMNVMGKSGGSNSLLLPALDMPPMETYPVNVIPLDSLLLTELAFMKIDVEGWELELLKGAEKTISRCKPILLIETWNKEESRNTLVGFLNSLNYEIKFNFANFPDMAYCTPKPSL